MSGGGKGGSQTSEVKIPKWLESEARQNIDIARDIAKIGFVPDYGPAVAAFTPMQEASFANTGAAANAFGLESGGSGMPEAQTFAGGVRGYSSAPLFEENLAALEQNRPGQFNAINSMFIDPFTGGPAQYANFSGQPGGPQQPQINPQDALSAINSGDQGALQDYAMAMKAQQDADRAAGFFGSGAAGGQGSMTGVAGPQGGGSFTFPGGYTGFGDMIDGGGAGASGPSFQGGGLLSGVGNMVASPVSRDGGGGMGGGK